MKKITIILVLLFWIGIIKCDAQTIYKDNFKKITDLYLENIPKKFTLDTSTTVFVISVDSCDKDDCFFFGITFTSTNFLVNLKYSQIYTLGNYKLVFTEGVYKYPFFTNLFKKRPFENLNKGKVTPGLCINDSHQWYFLMNNRLEIHQVNGYPPNFSIFKRVVKMLKQHKVVFAKSPFPEEQNGKH